MKKRFSYLPFALLFAALFFLMSLPRHFQSRLRLFAVSSLAPFYEGFSDCRHFLGKTVFFTPGGSCEQVQNRQLAIENEMLKAQSKGVYEWLKADQRIEEQIERLKFLSSEKEKQNFSEPYWKDFFQRRSVELKDILKQQVQSVPAKVVFRDPANWHSCLWINIGENLNEALGRKIVCANSPVAVGDAIVGVIEYVGQKFSRLRLITDANLSVSARASRGSEADRVLALQCKSLKDALQQREDLMQQGDKKLFFDLLQEIREKLLQKKADYYLAKGEVRGAMTPHLRSSADSLQGIGFNYDFADSEGPARDLKTGKALDDSFKFLNRPLIKKGDLLVTTGLDGVFPAGLKIGLVTEVGNLSDAGYFYEIKARPAVLDLADLNVVFVLPPSEFLKNRD